MFLPLDEMFKPRSRLPVQVDVKNPMALFEKRRGILSLGVLAKNPPNIFARSVAVCGTLLCAIGLGTSEVWTTQKYEIPNLRPVQGNCPGQPSLYLINTVFPCLGIFNHTDTCCREHDHCKHKLAAFEYNYGMRNFRLHTISHCDCDYRFKYCLLQLNDTVSTLVGMAFFNLLEIPCFTLEKVEQCVRWTWWGSNSPANTTSPPPCPRERGQRLTQTSPSPTSPSPTSPSPTSPSPTSPSPTSPSPSSPSASSPSPTSGYKRCGCYKRLDRCEHKIEPKQFKFYYHNLEPKTVYHCNCTKRLVKRMKKEGNPEALQAVLSDFVSLSCFYLKEPKGECSEEGRNL
uniref:Phospholipase A2-like central domain-containing protein n=1 Tax=Callorhinchus milii TaxID=7868 RepID=A0A4W3K6K8_CALMI